MITNLVTVLVTAYCHCTTCCGKPNQPTASGLPPTINRTIAASRSIPFGTQVFIPQIGWRRVEDRLAKKYDNRVDVFVGSHREAKKLGIKKKTITIITE